MPRPTLEEVTALFDRRRSAWLAEDHDAYLACFADDVELVVPGQRPVRGRAEYAEVVRRAAAWARPLRFDVHHLAVAPDGAVLAEWTIAVARRDRAGVVEWRGMSVCGLEGDRIRWWREYWDPASLVAEISPTG